MEFLVIRIGVIPPRGCASKPHHPHPGLSELKAHIFLVRLPLVCNPVMKSILNRVIWLFLMFSCFQIESVFAAPDVFTLTSATPGCNGSSPQITLNWTTSSGVVTYDLYRNGSLYVADLPANGRSFPDTG